MKKKLLSLTLTGVASLSILSSYSGGPSIASPGNRTGSGGTATAGCAGAGCHGPSSTTVTAAIGLFDGANPVSTYVPGKQYTVLLSGTNSAGNHPKFGFQATCVKDGTNTSAGTLSSNITGVNVEPSVAPGPVTLVQNTQTLMAPNGAGTPNIHSVSFKWTAPAAATGAIKFYAVLNSVDGNGAATTNDVWATTTSPSYSPGTTGVASVTGADLNLFPNPATDVLQVSGCGPNSLLQVIDFYGRILISERSAGKDMSIQISSLPVGMYGLRISAEGLVRTRLFLKK
jgi:hypothetical protein